MWRKALSTSWWMDSVCPMGFCPTARARLCSCTTQCIWAATWAAETRRSIQRLCGLTVSPTVALYCPWSPLSPGPQRSDEQRERMHSQLQDERGGSLGRRVQLRHLALLQQTHREGRLLWRWLHLLRFVFYPVATYKSQGPLKILFFSLQEIDFSTGSQFDLSFELRPHHLTGVLFIYRNDKASIVVFMREIKVRVKHISILKNIRQHDLFVPTGGCGSGR